MTLIPDFSDKGAGSALAELYVEHDNPLDSGLEVMAIRAFEQISGNEAWLPEHPYLGLKGFGKVIELGLLALLLEPVPNSARLLAEAASQVRADGFADPDLWAELNIAALLVQCGHQIEFVPTQRGVRTPDIRVLGANGPIDVEVRRGDQRLQHSEFRDALAVLASRLGREDADVVVHLSERAVPGAFDEVADAATKLQPGGVTELTGEWRVAVIAPQPVDGDGFQDLAAERRLHPEWWELPAFFVSTGTIGGARVDVSGQVPLASYFNPVRDKADRPQRTGDYPYVIALDTSSLMDAEKRLLPELNLAAPAWDHVSGVLMAYPFFAISNYGWRASLFRNPHATHQLDSGFMQGLGDQRVTVPLP